MSTMPHDEALAIVRALLPDDRLDSRETEALEVLLAAASAPAPLAVRQDIEALRREQGTSRFVLGPAIGKTEVRYADGIKRALDVLCPHLERLTSPPTADQIVAVLDDAADRWSTSIERADTPDRDRPHAKKLSQARAVLALLGATS